MFVLRTSDKECVTTNGLGLYLVVCSDFTKQLLCHIRSTRDSLTYNSISSTAVPLQLIARDTRKLCMPFFLGIENPGMERNSGRVNARVKSGAEMIARFPLMQSSGSV